MPLIRKIVILTAFVDMQEKAMRAPTTTPNGTAKQKTHSHRIISIPSGKDANVLPDFTRGSLV